MSAARSALVLGGGVVGLSVALSLIRKNWRVSIIDPFPSPGGASYGNAGLLSPDTATPIALPGMLPKVPKWLMAPLGPLTVRVSYLPKATPWLLKWIAAGRIERVREISRAMRALHKDSLQEWRTLLGGESFADLIRTVGTVQLWDDDAPNATAQIEEELRRSHGVETQPLSREEIFALFPGITKETRRGLLIKNNAYTVNPQRLVQTLARQFEAEGGTFIREKVYKLIPEDDGKWLVMTNVGNHRTGHVVVAMGAFSKEVLAPLGVKVALETERGYHATLPNPSITLPLPILHKSRSMAVTPMEGGLRVAGTVEIGGLHAAPNEERAKVLYKRLQQLFPDLKSDPPQYWMGFRPSTPDSLPVLGPIPGKTGLYACFGHSHFGMTTSAPSGRLLAEIINGEKPHLDVTPYAITRFA